MAINASDGPGGRACSNLSTCAYAVARCLFLRFGVLLPLLSRWDALLDLDSAVLVPSSQHKKHELSFRVTVLLGAEPRDLPGLLTALLSGARARRMVSTYSFYFCRNGYCVMVSVLMNTVHFVHDSNLVWDAEPPWPLPTTMGHANKHHSAANDTTTADSNSPAQGTQAAPGVSAIIAPPHGPEDRARAGCRPHWAPGTERQRKGVFHRVASILGRH